MKPGARWGAHCAHGLPPIIRMWRFTRNNGITEGFRRKMKLIQRRAYGFRNFENYRLRVLIECGHLHIPQKDVFNNVWG